MVIDAFNLNNGRFLIIEIDKFGNIDFSVDSSNMVWLEGELKDESELAKLMMILGGQGIIFDRFDETHYLQLYAVTQSLIQLRVFGKCSYKDYMRPKIILDLNGNVRVHQVTAVQLLNNRLFRQEFYNYLPIFI